MKKIIMSVLILTITLFNITGCAPVTQTLVSPGLSIHLNQLGYLPDGYKSAVVVGDAAKFMILDPTSQEIVFQGQLGEAKYWEASGETVRIADFSNLTSPGTYRIKIGEALSDPFAIDQHLYADLGTAALKAYYFNRVSTELEEPYAGVYARPAGHPDNQVLIHASAATEKRPEGTIISSPRGWYDAGDYNKYIVNSAITVSTMMSLYEQFPMTAAGIKTNIPESANDIPDILDEIRWNLDWMLSMQDPEDGGVYHKLTNLNFEGFVSPEAATAPRFVVMKTTSAALDFSASMAQASRIYKAFDSQFATTCLRAAERAWEWAEQNPDIAYEQPEDVQTGTYSQSEGSFQDERFWAATELALTRGETSPTLPPGQLQVPDWANVSTLAVIDQLALSSNTALRRAFLQVADSLVAIQALNPYAVSNEIFRWGSNSDFLNQALVLIFAYKLTEDTSYRSAAQADFDWVLGKNPLGISFVTGYGTKTPMHIHHRPSESDGIDEPQPGWVAGGPNPGNKYDCGDEAYPSPFPALAYVDQLCSYATNEIAINWNAPLVYVSFALMAATR